MMTQLYIGWLFYNIVSENDRTENLNKMDESIKKHNNNQSNKHFRNRRQRQLRVA